MTTNSHRVYFRPGGAIKPEPGFDVALFGAALDKTIAFGVWGDCVAVGFDRTIAFGVWGDCVTVGFDRTIAFGVEGDALGRFARTIALLGGGVAGFGGGFGVFLTRTISWVCCDAGSTLGSTVSSCFWLPMDDHENRD